MIATATLRRPLCREFGRRPAAVVVFGENVRRAVSAPLPAARAKIWCHTQGVYPPRDSVALMRGISNANIRVIFVEGSGCYGLNGSDSAAYAAAIGNALSDALGQNPILLIGNCHRNRILFPWR